jgi:hypothetical protein
VFDCYEYLRQTGQLSYRARHFTIAFAPFNEERIVLSPAIDPTTGEVTVDEKGEQTMLEEKRNTWTWSELKALILSPEKRHKKWDLVAACRRQIDDESAFRLYFENMTAAAVKTMAREADD